MVFKKKLEIEEEYLAKCVLSVLWRGLECSVLYDLKKIEDDSCVIIVLERSDEEVQVQEKKR